jgi:hypothetical protein
MSTDQSSEKFSGVCSWPDSQSIMRLSAIKRDQSATKLNATVEYVA